MAAYRWIELLRQADQNQRLERQDVHESDPDASVPVAALPKGQFARATRIEVVDGVPVFRDEVEIKVYPGQEKCLVAEGHEDGGQQGTRVLRWRALDVVTRDAKAKRHTAVAVTHPYSTDWFDAAPFKRTLHGARRQIEQARRAACSHPAGHLAYLRDEISFDVFETRTGYLTASLTAPRRSPGDVATGRRWDRWTGGRVVPLPRSQRDVEHGVRQMKRRIDEAWVFGICPDLAACREALMDSDLAKALLDATLDRTVLERHYLGRRGARARELREDVVSHASDVLESSIAKSLAGPVDFQAWTRRREPFVVAELMRDIYLSTIYALNERNPQVDTPEGQGGAGQGGAGQGGAGSPAATAEGSPGEVGAESDNIWFSRQLEAYESSFGQAFTPHDVDEATRALWSTIPERRFEACFVLAAMARRRSPADLPLGELEDLATTDPHPDVQAVARMTLQVVSEAGGHDVT